MESGKFDKVGGRIRWGYLVAFLLLLISYILSFYTNKRILNESNWVNRTHLVVHDLEVLISGVKEAESGIRGYYITGNSNFLDHYTNARNTVDSVYNEVYQLSSENAVQQHHLQSIHTLIYLKFINLKTGLEVYGKNNHVISDSLKNLTSKGRVIMDSIRQVAQLMKAEENNQMAQRSGQITNFSHFINVINITSLLIAIVMIFYSLLTFNKENTAKKEADLETLKYRQQLELRVSELDKLNAELVELKSIEKFALTGRISRTIAHEVRNPLTNINLAVEQLRVELEQNEDSIMLLDMISRNGTRINLLISDLLNSTRTNLLNFEKRNLNDLIDESLHFAQDRIELKSIKVIKEFTNEICEIEVDTQKINIAFLNIIVNACEAMEPNKGILKVITEKKNDKCFVTISDNGKGIDEENVSRLFEPYFTTKESGTGLGLTNTQNIILSHNASISAESNPGKGTTFIISFNC